MSDDKLPKSKMARLSVAGKTAAKIGTKKAQFLMKSAFADENKKKVIVNQQQQELADILFKGLSQLRGTALKIAQVLCGETGILPPEYLKKLELSCYQTPPLNRAVVHRVIQNNLGQPPQDIFASFDSTAFAAASLGQVHRATSKQGEELAVKVQYPGISDTIRSDLQLAKTLLRPLRDNQLLQQTLHELEAHLFDETDYQKELENTLWFSENLKDQGLQIPKVYPQLSGPQVLTTELMKGLHLKEWLQKKPNQKVRQQQAHRLMHFFWQGLLKQNRIHSDPNMGNFLFMESGELGLIDFGSVQKVSADEAKVFQWLWQPKESFNPSEVVRLYVQLGAEISDDQSSEFFDSVIKPYRDWVMSLPTHFKASDSYAYQGQKTLNDSAFDKRMQKFSTRFTMIHRTLFGLVQTFQKMDVEIDLSQCVPKL